MTEVRRGPGPFDLVLRRIRPWGRGDTVDMAIAAGRIAATGSDLSGHGLEEVDLVGAALIPAFIEPHIHLDKAFTLGQAEATTLAEAGRASLAALGDIDAVAARVRLALSLLVSRGVVTVRTHVNVGTDIGLANLRTVMDVAREVEDRITVQTVAFADRRLEPDGPGWDLLSAAIDAGCTAIGGGTTRRDSPESFVSALCRLAADTGCSIDLHVDEHLEPDCPGLEALVAQVARFGLRGRAIAGHCCSLGSAPETTRARLIDALAAQEIGVVVLPLTNLFLQGRDGPAGTGRRGLAPIDALLVSGVRVSCGTDNLQDAYLPFGNGDPQLVLAAAGIAGQVSGRGQEWLATAMTSDAAEMLGVQDVGLIPGCRADLIAFDYPARCFGTAPSMPKCMLRDGRLT